MEAKNGDALLLPVKMFTLTEKMSPIIAAYQIAMEIMDDDEKEVFHIINLPEDATAEEIIAELEKLTALIQESREKLKPLMRQSFPVDMKFRHVNGQNNFEKAILAVLCPDVRIEINTSKVVYEKSLCTDFVIDEMTAVFLAFLGPDIFNNCTWHMTEYVYDLLSQYCDIYKGKRPVLNEKYCTVYFEDFNGEVSLSSDFISHLTSILERSQKHSDSKLNIPLNIKLKLRDVFTHSFLMSHALAISLNIGHFCIDHFTRFILQGFSSIPLQPDDFQEKIINNSSIEVIHNLIDLNIHNNLSSIAYTCLHRVIHEGDTVQLGSLKSYIEAHSSNWEPSNIKFLVEACLFKLMEKALLKEADSGVENVMLALLQSLTSCETLSDQVIQLLLECLLMPLVTDEFLELTPQEARKLVIDALHEVTELYCNCLSKAVRNNSHSVSAFWNSLAKLCNE
ncbi:hypothetical protein GCM10007169_19550 [Shewanella fodinae]|nr:hypothetical protein GCM10007169_19550 [Shewanella fodinae]